MKISPDEVEHVARLARLEVSPNEKEDLTRQMNRILQYVEKLNELDTTGVSPTWARLIPAPKSSQLRLPGKLGDCCRRVFCRVKLNVLSIVGLTTWVSLKVKFQVV